MKKLFGDALERPEQERESFVTDASHDDPQLGREVRDMLRAYAVQDGFIEQSAAEHLGWTGDSAAPDWIGRKFGPYRVVAEAGRGGLGRVFRAVREDGEVEQQVAIKLLHAGLGTEALLARFRAERRILARLNHPHIAHFLDGAATEDGLPYLVMEFVEGEPIDDYCDSHALGLEARLQLFRDLCSAVHHVHQNLLVHGDIKGGNVLVTREGSVKLLDFGIAKLLDPAGNVTGRPATLLLMTPEYASPEQRRGESITTASDVYSLGALLYMLLTGSTPAATSTADRPPSATAADRHTADIAPSIAAAQAGGAYRGFARALGGDLDTIVLKALRAEPRERYGSAEQLSDDLQRYLRGFPIEARPDSAWYRIGKFARRNAAAAIATGLFVVALVGGGAAAAWQAHEARVERERAERHFQTVRKLSAAFLGDVYDSIAKIPGSTGARKLLVDNTLGYLEALERDAPDSVELRRDLGIAWERLGDVQGAYLQPSLGEIEQSFDSYRRALAIRGALVAEHPTPQHRIDLLSIQVTLGEALLSADGAEEARRVLSSAIANADAVVASVAAGPEWRKAAAAHMVHGWSEWSGGRVESGMASLQRARELYEAIAAATPGDRTARRDVA
ncbi:MAG: serine/threonine protein kinase, partial [Steroidobacteraceae bacterium]